MQVQSINNYNNSLGFKSAKSLSEDEIKERLEVFANLPDKEVRKIALEMSADPKKDKKAKRAYNNAFYSLPLVAGAAAAILTRSTLAARTAVGVSSAVGWGSALALVAVYEKVKKSLVKKSETYNSFTMNNPIMSLGVDLLLLFAGIRYGGKLASKGIDKILEKNPKMASRIEAKSGKLFDKLDSSDFNTKTLPKWNDKADKFAEKHSSMSSALRGVLNWSPIILIFGSFMKYSQHKSQRQHETMSAYTELKHAQLESSKLLSELAKAEAVK